MQRPHVVLLGAGASRAACPDGDAVGKPVPLMNDLVRVLGLEHEVPSGLDASDFESLYGALKADPNYADQCDQIEHAIHEYFAALSLPDIPTVYDYLVLALREKDVIATFNWDPFLLQAAQRCYRARTRPPQLVFLHGNVAIGSCVGDRREGPIGTRCSRCRKPFSPSQLLYPIAEKNYRDDPQIAAAWSYVQNAFQCAFMVTIFGYSAPQSDAAAIDLLRTAWGSSAARELEQFEIIDIRDPEALRATWDEFIHTDHYDIYDDFFASSLARHPRRTGEAYWRQHMEAQWVHPNPAPRHVGLDELRRWHIPLHDVELNRARER